MMAKLTRRNHYGLIKPHILHQCIFQSNSYYSYYYSNPYSSLNPYPLFFLYYFYVIATVSNARIFSGKKFAHYKTFLFFPLLDSCPLF